MLRLVCLICMFCLAQTSLFAQAKKHFRVLENGQEIQQPALERAVNELGVTLESLRYTDANRSIAVQGTNYVVELISAESLAAQYGKRVRPQNRPASASISPNLYFVWSLGEKTIKPVFE